jgi:hypothetical protein
MHCCAIATTTAVVETEVEQCCLDRTCVLGACCLSMNPPVVDPVDPVIAKQSLLNVRLDSQDLDSDKLRVTYIRSGDDVLLVELFAKNEKSRENQERITKYTK